MIEGRTEKIIITPEGVWFRDALRIAGIGEAIFRRDINPNLSTRVQAKVQWVSLEQLTQMCSLSETFRLENPTSWRRKQIVVEYQLPEAILLHYLS